MFIIPEQFAQLMIELFGEEGRDWLVRLPALLADCEKRWNLTIGTPFSNLTFNYLAPAIWVDGRPVIVKIGRTDEFSSQPEALRHFDGHGMVQLLARHPLSPQSKSSYEAAHRSARRRIEL